MEQTIAQEGFKVIELFRDWGPLWSIFFIIAIYHTFGDKIFKKKCEEDKIRPQCRDRFHKASEDIHEISLSLERHPTYEWIEKEHEKYQRKDMANQQYKELIKDIDELKEYLARIEKKLDGNCK